MRCKGAVTCLINCESPKACYYHQAALKLFLVGKNNDWAFF